MVQPASEPGVCADVGGLRDVEPRRVIAVLVLKHAFEHEKLFPAAMAVRREVRLAGHSGRSSWPRATSPPMRSSMRRSTPAIGEGIQSRVAA